MRDLSHKIGTTIQPVFIRKKLGQDLNRKEIKPPIVNQQCDENNANNAESKMNLYFTAKFAIF